MSCNQRHQCADDARQRAGVANELKYWALRAYHRRNVEEVILQCIVAHRTVNPLIQHRPGPKVSCGDVLCWVCELVRNSLVSASQHIAELPLYAVMLYTMHVMAPCSCFASHASSVCHHAWHTDQQTTQLSRKQYPATAAIIHSMTCTTYLSNHSIMTPMKYGRLTDSCAG